MLASTSPYHKHARVPIHPRQFKCVRYCCSGGSVPTVKGKLPLASEAIAKHAAVGRLTLPEFSCTGTWHGYEPSNIACMQTMRALTSPNGCTKASSNAPSKCLAGGL